MSKEFNNIDDLFQSAFAGESTEVPAFVKVNIDKKIGFKKDKRGWFWLSGLAALIVITTAMIWHLNDSPKNLAQTSSDSNEQTLTENQSQNNSSIENKISEEIIEKNNSGTNGSDISNDNSAPVDSRDIRSKATSENNTSKSSDEKLNDQNADTKTNDQSVQISSHNNNSVPEKSSDELIDTGSETIYKSSGSTGSDNFQRPALAIRMYEKQEDLKNNNRTNSALEITNPSLAIGFTTPSELDAAPMEKKETYNPWMISLTGGLNYSKSKYTFPSAAEKDFYTKSTFSPPRFEVNADVKYRLPNSLTFSTGLGISKLSENYQFFKESLDIDTTITWQYQDIYEYDSLLDSTIFVGIDSTSTTTYDSTQVTLYNEAGVTQATYLHIPFSIGTQIIRNKFRFDLFAAGRFNYLLSGSGGYLQNDVFISFNKQQNQIFKTWTVDLILGASIHYQLFEKLYVSGTMRFNPGLVNLYDGLSFSRSVQSTHIGVGLSWKL